MHSPVYAAATENLEKPPIPSILPAFLRHVKEIKLKLFSWRHGCSQSFQLLEPESLNETNLDFHVYGISTLIIGGLSAYGTCKVYQLNFHINCTNGEAQETSWWG